VITALPARTNFTSAYFRTNVIPKIAEGMPLVHQSFDILTYSVWQALSPRLSLYVSPECLNRRLINLLDSMNFQDIPDDGESDFIEFSNSEDVFDFD
jgi:hypothetical protein